MNLFNKKEQGNPTTKTQEDILEILKQTKQPISITTLAKSSGHSFYQTRASVDFLSKFGVVEVIKSSKNTTLVQLKKQGEKNATSN